MSGPDANGNVPLDDPPGPRRRAVAHPPSTPGVPVDQRPYIPGAGPPASTPTQQTVLDPRDYTVTLSAAGLPKDIPLGRCLQPQTKLIYAESWSNSTVLTWIVSLGEGPIQSVQPLADGKPLRLVSGSFTTPNGTLFVDDTGLVRVYVYDGSQTSIASSGLGVYDPLAAAEEVHTGLAMAVVFITFDPDKMNSVPTFTWILEGYRLCKDPLDGVRKYSNIPAIHARELLTNTTWGMQMPDDTIHLDDHATNLGGWGRAVTDCKTAIFPPTPSSAPTLANSGSGNIPAGVYSYTFTSVTGNGVETLESPASSFITISTPSKVTVTVPAGGAGTVERNVYRNASPTAQTPRYLVGTITNNTAGATLLDNINNTTLLGTGVSAPTVAPRPERFIAGILISRVTNGQDWLDTILAHFAGKVTIDNGRYQCRVDQKIDVGYTPMVLRDTIYDDGLSVTEANVEPLSVEVWRKDEVDLFNTIIINYQDANNNFQPASVTLKRAKVLALLERPRVATYELPGCPDKNQALRIATLYLNRAWDDLCWRIRGDRSLIALQPGLDVAQLFVGGLNFLGRVLKLTGDGDVFVAEGEEYQDLSYSEIVQNEDSPIGTIIPDPSATPPNPTNCSVREVLSEGGGVAAGYLLVSFTPAVTPFYRATRVVVNDGLNTYLAAEEAVGPIPLRNPRRGYPHIITLYTVTNRGTRISSGFTLPPITPKLLGPTIPDVLNLVAPFDTDANRGTITCTLPAYDGIDHLEVFDNYGSPAVPPRLASIPASSVVNGQAIRLPKELIHGDGYASDMVFSIIVKVVNAFGDKSPGVAVSWRVAQNGHATYTVGYDPRDVTFDGSKIWLSNYNGANVSRLDRSTGLVDLTVNVGSKPFGILYANGYVWVANFGSDTITRMLPDGSGVTSIALTAGDGPLGLTKFTTSGNLSYIAISCHKTGKLKFIDLSTLSLLSGSSVTVGRTPCFMYPVTIGGKMFLYICNYLDNTVSVMNEVGTIVATIPVGAGPFGLTYDGTYLWICNYADSTLSLINPNTNTVVNTISLGTHTGPTDAAYLDGYVWVTEAQARQVTRVNATTFLPTAHDPLASSPRSILYDGTEFWMPMNLNDSSSTVPVTVTNPTPGGGTSAPVKFTILGVDPSPLPS